MGTQLLSHLAAHTHGECRCWSLEVLAVVCIYTIFFFILLCFIYYLLHVNRSTESALKCFVMN